MSDVLFSLKSIATADVSPFNRSMDASASAAHAAFSAMSAAANAFIGSGVVRSFIKATDAANKFGQTIADISAIADYNLKSLRTSILQLENVYGRAASVGDTVYEIISSGVRGSEKELIEFTKVAKQTAVAIKADLYDTANVMTTLTNAYGLGVKDAKKLSDMLFVTVREGKAHGNELARTLGLVTNTAAEAGVSLAEMSAVISVLSRTQSASQSMIGFNQLLNAIIKPTQEATREARYWGIELSATALKTKGLAGVLTELHDKTGGNVRAINAMLGNIRAMRAGVSLTGRQFENFIKILRTAELEIGSGAAFEAFEKQTNTARQSAENLSTQLDKTFIQMGTELEPVMRTVTGLAERFLKVFSADDWASSFNRGVTYVAMFGLVLSGAMKTIAGIVNVTRAIDANTKAINSTVKGADSSTKSAAASAGTLQKHIHASIADAAKLNTNVALLSKNFDSSVKGVNALNTASKTMAACMKAVATHCAVVNKAVERTSKAFTSVSASTKAFRNSLRESVAPADKLSKAIATFDKNLVKAVNHAKALSKELTKANAAFYRKQSTPRSRAAASTTTAVSVASNYGPQHVYTPEVLPPLHGLPLRPYAVGQGPRTIDVRNIRGLLGMSPTNTGATLNAATLRRVAGFNPFQEQHAIYSRMQGALNTSASAMNPLLNAATLRGVVGFNPFQEQYAMYRRMQNAPRTLTGAQLVANVQADQQKVIERFNRRYDKHLTALPTTQMRNLGKRIDRMNRGFFNFNAGLANARTAFGKMTSGLANVLGSFSLWTMAAELVYNGAKLLVDKMADTEVARINRDNEKQNFVAARKIANVALERAAKEKALAEGLYTEYAQAILTAKSSAELMEVQQKLAAAYQKELARRNDADKGNKAAKEKDDIEGERKEAIRQATHGLDDAGYAELYRFLMDPNTRHRTYMETEDVSMRRSVEDDLLRRASSRGVLAPEVDVKRRVSETYTGGLQRRVALRLSDNMVKQMLNAYKSADWEQETQKIRDTLKSQYADTPYPFEKAFYDTVISVMDDADKRRRGLKASPEATAELTRKADMEALVKLGEQETGKLKDYVYDETVSHAAAAKNPHRASFDTLAIRETLAQDSLNQIKDFEKKLQELTTKGESEFGLTRQDTEAALKTTRDRAIQLRTALNTINRGIDEAISGHVQDVMAEYESKLYTDMGTRISDDAATQILRDMVLREQKNARNTYGARRKAALRAADALQQQYVQAQAASDAELRGGAEAISAAGSTQTSAIHATEVEIAQRNEKATRESLDTLQNQWDATYGVHPDYRDIIGRQINDQLKAHDNARLALRSATYQQKRAQRDEHRTQLQLHKGAGLLTDVDVLKQELAMAKAAHEDATEQLDKSLKHASEVTKGGSFGDTAAQERRVAFAGALVDADKQRKIEAKLRVKAARRKLDEGLASDQRNRVKLRKEAGKATDIDVLETEVALAQKGYKTAQADVLAATKEIRTSKSLGRYSGENKRNLDMHKAASVRAQEDAQLKLRAALIKLKDASLDTATSLRKGLLSQVQNFAKERDAKGNLTNDALYHSINLMSRLGGGNAIQTSRGISMSVGGGKEVNFKNAQQAQTAVARSLDAYILSQQYAEANKGRAVVDIYNLLKTNIKKGITVS